MQSFSDPAFSSEQTSLTYIRNHLITLNSLPPELQMDVLAFLTPEELAQACATSKKLRSVGMSDQLWKCHIEQALSTSPLISSSAQDPPDRIHESCFDQSSSVQTPNGTAVFSSASSCYEVYRFIRTYSNLLGFWQGDLPNYGKTIRISFVPESSTNPNGPSFVCQEVKLSNELAEVGWERWQELTSFELGRSVVTGMGGGTQLERWNEMLKIDLCYPAMRFADLWRADWRDSVEKLRSTGTKEKAHRGKAATMLWRRADQDQQNQTNVSPNAGLSKPQETLDLCLQRVDLYEGVEQEFARWKWPTEHGFLPYRFPTPSALPAFSSVECFTSSRSEVDQQVTAATLTPQAVAAGTRIKINRLTMRPNPPPYYQSDRALDFHNAYRDKPLSFFPLKPLPRKGLRELPMWDQEQKVFHHRAPPPELDPSHIDFDWNKLEGIYGVSYGPHGVELIYIRTRTILEEELEKADSEETPEEMESWWPEPSLHNHSNMAISKSSIKPGFRVLEGVKITGDFHVPRGSITFRAFLDDPSCVSIPWRAPPPSKRTHLPFPHRTDENSSGASMLPRTSSADTALAPGYLAPAHGRISEAGFVDRNWLHAQIHISSVDEWRLWWFHFGAISHAQRLIG